MSVGPGDGRSRVEVGGQDEDLGVTGLVVGPDEAVEDAEAVRAHDPAARRGVQHHVVAPPDDRHGVVLEAAGGVPAVGFRTGHQLRYELEFLETTRHALTLVVKVRVRLTPGRTNIAGLQDGCRPT